MGTHKKEMNIVDITRVERYGRLANTLARLNELLASDKEEFTRKEIGIPTHDFYGVQIQTRWFYLKKPISIVEPSRVEYFDLPAKVIERMRELGWLKENTIEVFEPLENGLYKKVIKSCDLPKGKRYYYNKNALKTMRDAYECAFKVFEKKAVEIDLPHYEYQLDCIMRRINLYKDTLAKVGAR